MREVAGKYLGSGLCVLPARRIEKRPAIKSWKQYQSRLPTAVELDAWFSNLQDGLCIIAGIVSGNLEMIDFDNGGELFDRWYALVADNSDGLLDKLVIEQTQSGGWHVCYRCQSVVAGNMKLAQRRDDGKVHTLIETRGEGGLFLCAPTAGYELMQGDFGRLPVLTEIEREILLQAAWTLNEHWPEAVDTQPSTRMPSDTVCPGDDFNQRGDVAAILRNHGWICVAEYDENQRWRRPGKDRGWSATLRTTDNVFYAFSSNAAPFEPNKAYSPFAVYTLLEHGGDYASAAQALSGDGYGDPMNDAVADDVDISALIDQPEEVYAADSETRVPDPGSLPDDLLRVPGFISELMDFCLASAPYPNQGLAFCGALAMQSFLCGRKVRDPGNLRTNLYLLALAGSSSGKDWPRQLNAHIMMETQTLDAIGDKFASGEGIQDAMNLTPSMLFQNDEIDGMLTALNKAKDARFESIMGTLLTMYTSSGSVYALRRKAGKQSGGIIDQPHLTLFGTATPKHYYESLSERMLTNGFFARMIVVDIGYRGKGKDAGLADQMPERIISTARWWTEFCPGEHRHNLAGFHPQPLVIDIDSRARDILDDFRIMADTEYASAESDNDECAKAIWGRANENARKLALLYACSENHKAPVISSQGADWAVRFVDHQVRRMLFLAAQHVYENEFDKRCKKMIQVLRSWKALKGKGAWMPHWELSRRLNGWTEKDIEMVRDSLYARLLIDFNAGSTTKGGPCGCRYRLL